MPNASTREIFIERSAKIHNSKYKYSNFVYVNNKTVGMITCPKHGDFQQSPNSHLRGSGCPTCSIARRSNMKIENAKNAFISKANAVHTYEYDYSLVEYRGNREHVNIICAVHGIFSQTPHRHLQGDGCPKCVGCYKDTESVIQEFIEVHKDTYDYSLVEYKTARDYVWIICPIHGKFRQRPNNHLSGQGCPHCKNNSKGENAIKKRLMVLDIPFISQKRYVECRDRRELPFDFYIPSKNLLIEYDGIQHFNPIEQFGGQGGYLNVIKHDILKNEFANDNNISLLRIPYWNLNNIENILEFNMKI